MALPNGLSPGDEVIDGGFVYKILTGNNISNYTVELIGVAPPPTVNSVDALENMTDPIVIVEGSVEPEYDGMYAYVNGNYERQTHGVGETTSDFPEITFPSPDGTSIASPLSVNWKDNGADVFEWRLSVGHGSSAEEYSVGVYNSATNSVSGIVIPTNSPDVVIKLQWRGATQSFSLTERVIFQTHPFNTSGTAPTFTSVTSSGVTDSSASIRVIASENVKCYLNWGITSGVYPFTNAPGENSLNFDDIAQAIPGLDDDTTYYYQAVIENSIGLTATSNEYSFTTLSASTVPTVTVTTNGPVVQGTTTLIPTGRQVIIDTDNDGIFTGTVAADGTWSVSGIPGAYNGEVLRAYVTDGPPSETVAQGGYFTFFNGGGGGGGPQAPTVNGGAQDNVSGTAVLAVGDVLTVVAGGNNYSVGDGNLTHNVSNDTWIISDASLARGTPLTVNATTTNGGQSASSGNVTITLNNTPTITVTNTGPNVQGTTTLIPAGRQVLIVLPSDPDVTGTVAADGTWSISGIPSTYDTQALRAYVTTGGSPDTEASGGFFSYTAGAAAFTFTNQPFANSVTATSIEVHWDTSVITNGTLRYSTNSNMSGAITRLATENSLTYSHHEQNFPNNEGGNLTPGTTYYFQVEASDGSNTIFSNIISATTSTVSSSTWDWGVLGGRIIDFVGNESVNATESQIRTRHNYSHTMHMNIGKQWFASGNSIDQATAPFSQHPNVSNSVFSKYRWAYTTPDRLYGCYYGHGGFGYWNPNAGNDTVTILYTLPHPDNDFSTDDGSTFNNEGNSDWNDEYWVVNAGNPARSRIYSFRRNPANDVITALGDMAIPTGFDYATYTPNGQYIVVKQNNTNPATYTRYNRDFTNATPINIGIGGSHECYQQLTTGEDVIVSCAIAGLVYVKLDDPGNPVVIPAGENAGSGHVDGPPGVPGIVIYSAGHYSGKPFVCAVDIESPTAKSWFLVNHGVDTTEYGTYNKNPQANASFDGDRIFYHRDDEATRMLVKN